LVKFCKGFDEAFSTHFWNSGIIRKAALNFMMSNLE